MRSHVTTPTAPMVPESGRSIALWSREAIFLAHVVPFGDLDGVLQSLREKRRYVPAGRRLR